MLYEVLLYAAKALLNEPQATMACSQNQYKVMLQLTGLLP